MVQNTYRPERLVWDNADFDTMGWHDATLWSMVANPEQFEFLVDLDYIFRWVDPGLEETHFRFWVAPVTMVFENACYVRIDIRSQSGSIEVANLHRDLLGPTPNGRFTNYAFRFECQEGEVHLQATGYKMYVRRLPVLLSVQCLELGARGGISFERSCRDA